MKINFILPFFEKTGGSLVVMEHSHRLSKMGHDVRVYYPLLPYAAYYNDSFPLFNLLRKTRSFFRNIVHAAGRASWFDKPVQFAPVPFISNHYIRDADAVIATAWPTAVSVARLSASKGQKFYFVQDYEIWNGNVEAVDSTYRLPMKLIVTSPWLKELMHEKFSREVEAEIHYGVDHQFFKPAQNKRSDPLKILMMYHIESYKGSADGLEVLRRVHTKYPHVQISVFGLFPFAAELPFIEYFRRPSLSQLLELYQRSHIFLSPSVREGWGMPITEAMACGCAVVATRTGCVPLLENDGNLLSADPGDRETMFNHIESLLNNPTRLREISERGHQSVLAYDWDIFSRQFEGVLMRSLTA